MFSYTKGEEGAGLAPYYINPCSNESMECVCDVTRMLSLSSAFPLCAVLLSLPSSIYVQSHPLTAVSCAVHYRSAQNDTAQLRLAPQCSSICKGQGIYVVCSHSQNENLF